MKKYEIINVRRHRLGKIVETYLKKEKNPEELAILIGLFVKLMSTRATIRSQLAEMRKM